MTSVPPSVQGNVRLILRLEGLCVLAVALALYHQLHGSWTTFALLFLLPDVSFLAYLINTRAGAIAYNCCHSYILPLIFAAAMLSAGDIVGLPLLLIWFAHIGFDRAAGYGLKYASAFGHTHLGHVGKRNQNQ